MRRLIDLRATLGVALGLFAATPCAAQDGFFPYFIEEYVQPAREGRQLNLANSLKIDAQTYMVQTPFDALELYQPKVGDTYIVTSVRVFPKTRAKPDATVQPLESGSVAEEQVVASIKLQFDTWLAQSADVTETATCAYTPENAITHHDYGRVAYFRTKDNKYGLVIFNIAHRDVSYADPSKGQDVLVTTMLMVADHFSCLKGT